MANRDLFTCKYLEEDRNITPWYFLPRLGNTSICYVIFPVERGIGHFIFSRGGWYLTSGRRVWNWNAVSHAQLRISIISDNNYIPQLRLRLGNSSFFSHLGRRLSPWNTPLTWSHTQLHYVNPYTHGAKVFLDKTSLFGIRQKKNLINAFGLNKVYSHGIIVHL